MDPKLAWRKEPKGVVEGCSSERRTRAGSAGVGAGPTVVCYLLE